MSSPPSPLPALASRRLVVVTGKGGVGKTVVAAALGRLFASGGRRVVVLEVDPRENAHQMLGMPPSGGEIVQAREGLYLQNLKPRQVLDEIVRERVRVGAVARRVLASPIYHQLADGMPGLREVALIQHALSLTGAGGGYDLVVLDAPATGHGVSLLAAPLLVSEVIAGGPVGRLAAELARFVADPGESAVAVVTQAEEMPVDEALELAEMLRRRVGREPELLVVNGLYPPAPEAPRDENGGDGATRLGRRGQAGERELPAPEAREGEDGEGEEGATALWRRRRRVNERELERLERLWRGPRVELPLLPIDRGPELVAALAERLAAAEAAP